MMIKKIRELYDLLDSQKIQHVTWKSLENLDKALNGVDDVDLLCKPTDRKKITALLLENGYIEDLYSPGCVYEDITVFRAFDPETCKFVMLHLHYALRLGGKKYKEYRFPFEQELLDNTQVQMGAVILKDSYFIITRLLQVTVKKAYQDLYTLELCKKYFTLEKTEQDIVDKYLFLYFQSDVKKLMDDILKKGLPTLEGHSNTVCESFDKHSSISEAKYKVDNHTIKKSLKFYWIPQFIRRKRNKLYQASSIVLAGHDGSGKTSTSQEIVKTLKSVASVKRIYLGRNKWSSFNQVLNKYRSKIKPLNLLWPISSTLEIVLRFLSGLIFTACGNIVVYDRTLDDLYLKYHDKNLLYSWFPKLSYKILSNYKIKNQILLIADSAVVIERKGMHDLKEIDQLRESYLDSLTDFTVLDTSHKNLFEVTGQIIEEAFFKNKFNEKQVRYEK